MREFLIEEQQVLQELYHRTPDATIKTRRQIILLLAKPMSVPQISQVTFYKEDTVARCIYEFNQNRLESLLPRASGGRPPKITPDYLKQLLLIIEQDPRMLGCSFSNWTAPLLAEYLATETGIRLDESRIHRYLHAHSYELLRPVLSVASPDPDYDSKRSRIEELQHQAERGKSICIMRMRSIWHSCPPSPIVGVSVGANAKSSRLGKIRNAMGLGSSIGRVASCIGLPVNTRITSCSVRFSPKFSSRPMLFLDARCTS